MDENMFWREVRIGETLVSAPASFILLSNDSLPFMHCPNAGDRSISIRSGLVGVILLFGLPEETNQQDFTSLKLVL